MYLSTIFSNHTFDCTISYDLDHSFVNIDHPIIDGFEGFYVFMYVVGNSSGGMIVHSNE